MFCVQANQRPDDLPDVVDDFDIPTMDEMPTEKREEFLAKIERRVKEYKVEVFNPPEENKKLLGAALSQSQNCDKFERGQN